MKLVVRAAAVALLAVASCAAARAEPLTVSAVAAAPAAADAKPVTEAKPALPAEEAKPAEAPAAQEAAKPAPPPPPRMIARIDLSAQRMTVTIDGKPAHSWAISSGRAPEYLTPTGTFRPQWAARMWYSKKYDDAPMPHAVFFNGGVAVHATSATGMLGRPASHGCVRLAPANAATFFALVHKYGFQATRIIVQGRTPGGEMASRKRNRDGDDRIAGTARRAPAVVYRQAPAFRQPYAYAAPYGAYRGQPIQAQPTYVRTPTGQVYYTYRVQPRAYANYPVYGGARSW